MKVGIIGSGVVDQALGTGFVKHGYEVMIGTREPEKLSAFKLKIGEKVHLASTQETAKFSNLLVLAVKGTKAKEALEQIGTKNLENKTVIDATNPIDDIPPENGVLRFFTSLDKSLMEEFQEIYPKTHFVKAFNSIGNMFMVNPQFKEKPTMFICGNDEKAKHEVTKICELFGFEVEDMGKAEAARAIEPLCMLWCIPGFIRNDWHHAFKLLKK